MQLPCRVERDTGATGLDFFNNSSPVLFGEIAFPSTRGRPELEARVKEEVMTKLRITENGVEIQFPKSLAIDKG